MIGRYTRPEMGRIWSTEERYQKWMEVEVAVCDALAEAGQIPAEAATGIRERAAFDADRVAEIEKVTRHDVIAFVTNMGESVGEHARYIHLGLTSSDVLDTALALQMVEAADLILKDLEDLAKAIKARAFEHKNTVMIGRSHGIHAEPITFGLKLALWYAETERQRQRMLRAQEVVRYGKISGAVGTYANISPEIEERVCTRLGLHSVPVASQIVQRDRHAEYLQTLALIAASLEKFALEVRHLQRTEVLEAEEFFQKGQKGSSAMPHKRNPITAEQICGLARVVRSNAMSALENVALWHERDISHSSVERVIIPDSTILVDYMLHKATDLISRLLVYPERMKENLERTGGMIFSQRVLLELALKGVAREEAYAMVQRNAMESWRSGVDFKTLLLNDGDIRKHLSASEVENTFDLRYHLKYVDTIFDRVFGKS